MKKYYSNSAILLITLVCIILNFSFKKWEKVERVIENDIHHYYGYLPALIIYNDLKLEKSDYRYGENLYWFWAVKTEDGKKVFKMTLGLAILYAPFFFAAHVFALVTEYSADGFTEPYKFFLLLSAIFYLLIGLDYTRKILQKLNFSDSIIAISLLLITLATNLIAYSTIAAPMPHVYNFMLFAMFIFYSMKWKDDKSIKNIVIIGFLLGIISLIRPTNLVIAIIPAIMYFKELFTWKTIKHLLLYALPAVFLIWLPQLAYWKYTTGHIFYYSYNEEGFNFLNPMIADGLFSFRKGWLIYTPIMIFAIIGIFLLKADLQKFRLPIIVFMCLNIYIIFSWWCWWYGGSFGQRPLIESYAILIIPFAAFINYLSDKGKFIKTLSIFAGVAFTLLNIFQMFQFQNSTLHWDSMSKELYFAQFGKLKPIPDFESYLDPPEYPLSSKELQSNSSDEQIFIKAHNSMYLSADNTINDTIIANRRAPQGWETFNLISLEEGYVAFQSHEGLYFCVEMDRNKELTASRSSIGGWEKFKLKQIDENSYTIMATNNKYLSLDPTTMLIYANKDAPGETEKFTIFRK